MWGGGDGGGARGGRSHGVGLKIALACLMISITMNMLFVLKLGERRGVGEKPSFFKRMRMTAQTGGGAGGGGDVGSGGEGQQPSTPPSPPGEANPRSDRNMLPAKGVNRQAGVKEWVGEHDPSSAASKGTPDESRSMPAVSLAASNTSSSAVSAGGSNSSWGTELEFGGTVEEETLAPASSNGISPDNPLHHWATAHVHGPILWKWNEYFDVYHRTFSRLRCVSLLMYWKPW